MKNLEKRAKEHICNPTPINYFGRTQYKCGCGEYFTKEEYNKLNKVNTKYLEKKKEKIGKLMLKTFNQEK